MSLKILVVEDEVLIAETIKLFIEEKGHEVTDMCISYEEAKEAYVQSPPDLVILDIRLYGKKSGIDFANFLLEQPLKIPFVYLTSQHDKRIFDMAIDTAPYGYLAKPIHKQTLWLTVEAAYQRFLEELPPVNELIISDGQSKHKISEQDITLIKADHVYSEVFLKDGRKLLVRKPLRYFEEQAQGDFLIQAHRSYIVNVREVLSWTTNSVTLADGQSIPVSRARKQGLFELLKQKH
ncbi:DNA-binding response regulator [Pontibacter sp. G13]|uniref:LytR/AlgR family response regulator transcription factor n=1 Tax=Pontibacter sp. G13 TaxID=3074898 RepID=UPI002889AC0F|nr:DNA-binding response regulator [Pontibacter sp. G13]WNJ17009.1 DNA-binding response regulator [Pontibacter sp. G13]